MAKKKSIRSSIDLSRIKERLNKTVDDPNVGNGQERGERPKMGNFSKARKVVSEIKYLVPGWVPYGMVTMILAEAGKGKSIFTINALVKPVTTGCNWFTGAKGPKPSPVIWCDTESSMKLNLDRAKLFGVPDEMILTLFEDTLKSLSLEDEEHLEHLEACINYHRTKLVVIDSLRGSHSGDENNSQIVKPMQAISQIAERTNAAVILIHHARKLHIDDDLLANSSRGSSAIVAMVRSQLGIDKPDPKSDWARLTMLKENLGLKPDPVGFRINKNIMEFGEAPTRPRKTTEKNKAADWLKDRMKPGTPYLSSAILEESEQSGISAQTLRKAASSLGVKISQRRKDGKIKGWIWVLPKS